MSGVEEVSFMTLFAIILVKYFSSSATSRMLFIIWS